MKNIFKLFIGLFFLSVLISCEEEGIDPISHVDPGPDQSAPQVMISYPLEGTVIQVLQSVATITIKFEATDDIELSTVKITLDGNQIASYDEFLDYRRFVGEYEYDQITDGPHTLTVTATDLDGKTGSQTVAFEKEPPYVPKYEGEILYMPFDGDFVDLVSVTWPTVVGNPGFAGESLAGLNAYAGAPDSYLTMPTDNFTNSEFSAVFWLKINATPDRAGILVMGPEDPDNPDAQNNRTSGFRFFRENAGGLQRFKLNAGNGSADTWFDGGAAADVDPANGDWVHFAFTISSTQCVVYIDGQVVKQGAFDGIDWTGCDVLSIMSGAPRFAGWNHRSDLSYMDELRLFNRELSEADIAQIIEDDSGQSPGYQPKYDGEIFYVPFDGDYMEMVSKQELTVVGTPGFAGMSKVGDDAYAGVEESYLTFPTETLQNDEFSAVFWLNINTTPDRAGVLVMGPEDVDNPDAQNLRTNGFRFFRENAGGLQRFKLNAGNGTADTWFDGGTDADVEGDTGEWTHFAFTISGTECVVYINGEVVKQGVFDGIDWTGCDVLSIMSGAPRFTGWDHWSDLSYMDELRIFEKALTQEEISTIIEDEQ